MNWTHGEKGPDCFCGMPTSVMASKDEKRVDLLCLFHTNEAGAMFALPKAGRPDTWPTITNEEMTILVNTGIDEQNSLEDEDTKEEI